MVTRQHWPPQPPLPLPASLPQWSSPHQLIGQHFPIKHVFAHHKEWYCVRACVSAKESTINQLIMPPKFSSATQFLRQCVITLCDRLICIFTVNADWNQSATQVKTDSFVNADHTKTHVSLFHLCAVLYFYLQTYSSRMTAIQSLLVQVSSWICRAPLPLVNGSPITFDRVFRPPIAGNKVCKRPQLSELQIEEVQLTFPLVECSIS